MPKKTKQPIIVKTDLGNNPHAAIEAAMESRSHGIWYWASACGYVKSRKAWRVKERANDTGKPGPWMYITDTDIEHACALMASKYPPLFARLLNVLSIDAPLGDMLIQLAVFGEEKYG